MLILADFLLEPGSYVGIIVFLILTGCGLPIPEEVPVIVAGVLAAAGQLNPWLALASCIFGALAGDSAMYWLGYHFGRGLLKDHPWWVRFVTPEREAYVERLFRQHGLKVFFAARFLVVLRSPLLIAAGIMRVSFVRFFLIDVLSATVVVGAFYALAYFYGRAVYEWIRTTEWLITTAAVAGAIGVVYFLWMRHRRRLGAATEDAMVSTEGTAHPEDPPVQPPAASRDSPSRKNAADATTGAAR